MPAISYRTDRECCDDPAPVGFDTTQKSHYHKGTGVWIRSACCGVLHYAERLAKGNTDS